MSWLTSRMQPLDAAEIVDALRPVEEHDVRGELDRGPAELGVDAAVHGLLHPIVRVGDPDAVGARGADQQVAAAFPPKYWQERDTTKTFPVEFSIGLNTTYL